MALNVTTATILELRLIIGAGVLTGVAVTYQLNTGSPDSYPAVHVFTTSPAQQTGAASFLAAVVSTIEAATGLTVTLNPD